MNLLKKGMDEPRSQIYEFGGFRVDVGKRLLTNPDNEQIPLTPKVFDTLLYLIRHGGRVIEKDELLREIWTDSIVEENNLNQNISILRRVFGEKPGEQRFIVTVAGHGYRFVPEATILSSTHEIAHSGIVERPEGASITEDNNDGRTSRTWFFVPILLTLALVAGGFYLWRGNEGTVDPRVQTIAVLPFKPLVPENRNEALELGMADTLISKLAGTDELVVRPLSAIRRYNSVDQDAITAGRELGVESVLDGTIQNWGDRIRVSAKLIRSSDGKQLWADQFDESFTDIFVVQDAISQKVAAALRIRLGGQKHSTENVEAYQLYMKGRYHVGKGTPPDLRASIPFFEQAIETDPKYALAYTGLSQAYGVLGITGDMEAVPKARAAERKALEIDDTLGEAHNSNCMGIFWYDWDWRSAEKECLRAIEIDPNNAEFHGNYALVLSNTGRHAEALAEAKRARELNPVNLLQVALEGQMLLFAGRTDEALDRLRKTSELEPRFWMPHFIAASAYIEKGMFAEAITESHKEYELTGRNEMPFGTFALARSGKRDEARAALEVLLQASATEYASPYNIALIYSSLDERHNALVWLEKGYDLRDPKMTFLKVEPKWNDLRNEPRFIALMRRMNFDL